MVSLSVKLRCGVNHYHTEELAKRSEWLISYFCARLISLANLTWYNSDITCLPYLKRLSTRGDDYDFQKTVHASCWQWHEAVWPDPNSAAENSVLGFKRMQFVRLYKRLDADQRIEWRTIEQLPIVTWDSKACREVVALIYDLNRFFSQYELGIQRDK